VTNGCLAAPEQISFPQYLREKGYLTACFGKLHTPGREKQDWDILKEESEGGPANLRDLPAEVRDKMLPSLFGFDDTHAVLAAPSPLPETETQEWRAGQDTIAFLKEKHDKPWLVQCSLVKPHPPLQPPQRFWDMIDESKFDVPQSHYPANDLDDKNPRYLRRMKGRRLVNLTDDQVRNAMHGYYANLAFSDHVLGTVLKQLDESGLRKNTLVMFTADHGEMLDDHRLWAKMVFFDASVRIPMIAHLPGRIEGGRQTQALVEHIDIFPTLMELLGYQKPASAQGKSFLSLAEGKTNTHKQVVYSEFPNIPIVNSDGSYNPSRMKFDGRYKVIDNGPNIDPELYDLQNDPREITNLCHDPSQQKRVQETIAHLRAWGQIDAVPVHPIGAVADPG
jgi:arylsulfatase A-like enzyme